MKLINKFKGGGTSSHLAWYDNGIEALLNEGIDRAQAQFIMRHAVGEGGWGHYSVGDGKNFSLANPGAFAKHIKNYLFTNYPDTRNAASWDAYLDALYNHLKSNNGTQGYYYNVVLSNKYPVNNKRTAESYRRNGAYPKEVVKAWRDGYASHFNGQSTFDRVANAWESAHPIAALTAPQPITNELTGVPALSSNLLAMNRRGGKLISRHENNRYKTW